VEGQGFEPDLYDTISQEIPLLKHF